MTEWSFPSLGTQGPLRRVASFLPPPSDSLHNHAPSTTRDHSIPLRYTPKTSLRSVPCSKQNPATNQEMLTPARAFASTPSPHLMTPATSKECTQQHHPPRISLDAQRRGNNTPLDTTIRFFARKSLLWLPRNGLSVPIKNLASLGERPPVPRRLSSALVRPLARDLIQLLRRRELEQGIRGRR